MAIADEITANNVVAQGPGDPPGTPPKGYVPTNPQQRNDWNGFIDYLHKQPNVDFNNPETGKGFLNQYKQENPKFSISPEMLENIQYEHNQFRTGDSFGNLTQEQLKAARTGMAPSFINQTNLYEQKYPQFKTGSQDFGTDIDAYVKSKMPINEPVPSTPSDAVPLPNFQDSKSRINYLGEIKKKYGAALMQGRGDTVLNVNEIPRGAKDTAKNIVTTEANRYGIDPSLLYSSAMEEGMSGLFKSRATNLDTRNRKPTDFGYQDNFGDKEFPINGNQSFGLPDFYKRFPELVQKGYLPKEFASRFKGGDAENNFKTTEDAVRAKAALMKSAYDDVDKYSTKSGIELSPQAKDFFALAEFNGGEGGFHKLLKKYSDAGLLKDDQFLKARPDAGQKIPENQDIYGHVIKRMQMRDLLKKEGLF